MEVIVQCVAGRTHDCVVVHPRTHWRLVGQRHVDGAVHHYEVVKRLVRDHRRVRCLPHKRLVIKHWLPLRRIRLSIFFEEVILSVVEVRHWRLIR